MEAGMNKEHLLCCQILTNVKFLQHEEFRSMGIALFCFCG